MIQWEINLESSNVLMQHNIISENEPVAVWIFLTIQAINKLIKHG